MIVSVLVHGGLLLAIAWLARDTHQSPRNAMPPPEPLRLVYLPAPGEVGGGGGGGGASRPLPPRAPKQPGHDATTVPVVDTPPPPVPVPTAAPERPEPTPAPTPEPDVPVHTLASGSAIVAGSVGASGDRNGGATPGPGNGPGDGIGLGPGRVNGMGGDVYQVGGGVTRPEVEVKVDPKYTTDALHARLSGLVEIECVVRPEGICTDFKLVRSLRDDLNAEALAAARQWRFKPGRRLGAPVPVWVTLQLAFKIH